ncbi:hypothetical protein OG21DRAFT_1602841 [Imleria badia]|nr:hypothetical protein OG21DRAFT_1602841 [Imleria badia]
MDTLPPSLLLLLIPFLPLTSLIAARGVNTQWRALAQTASLYPARKALLDLYLAAIAHPNFPSLVAALQPHVRAFDREAYVADLTSRGCVLPDVFAVWVLEWPSGAVHFWAWPGLAREFDVVHEFYSYGGGNALGDSVPTTDAIPVPNKEAASVGQTECRCLALWEIGFWCQAGVIQVWLVVDANERINERRQGRLLWTYAYHVRDADGTERPGPKRIFHDTPLKADYLIEFLDLLDSRNELLEYNLEDYYVAGVTLSED